MTIQNKTPLERAALQFKSAGLGDRSAWEAARVLLKTGVSFETAAVMGQRMDESCSATPATIQEAARRYRRVAEGPQTSTAWGRPLQEAEATSAGLPAVKPSLSETPGKKKLRHTGITRLINGVLHEEVVEYEQVTPDKPVTESERPKRTAWGRPLTEHKGA